MDASICWVIPIDGSDRSLIDLFWSFHRWLHRGLSWALRWFRIIRVVFYLLLGILWILRKRRNRRFIRGVGDPLWGFSFGFALCFVGLRGGVKGVRCWKYCKQLLIFSEYFIMEEYTFMDFNRKFSWLVRSFAYKCKDNWEQYKTDRFGFRNPPWKIEYNSFSLLEDC
jgi:hypothetical protein